MSVLEVGQVLVAVELGHAVAEAGFVHLVAEESYHFTELGAHVNCLLLVESVCVSIEPARGAFKFVNLRSVLSTSENLFDSLLSVGAFEIGAVQKEFHNSFKLRLRVGDQIFVANKERRHFVLLGVIDDLLVPSLDAIGAIFDPPVPELGVSLMILERCLRRVTRHGQQLEP